MKIQFLGAARYVTGSKHLITTEHGTRILLDCGFVQGGGKDEYKENLTFDFKPEEIDVLILSHAHIDHTGNVPNLVKQGFRGTIYTTPATRDLAGIMLSDSARIQESDTKYKNRWRAKKGKEPLKPLYTVANAEEAVSMIVSVPYRHKARIAKGVTVSFTDMGHILGSAAVNLEITEGNETKKLTFSGDIGRPYNKILKAPQPFPQCDYLITESTYGNKKHVTSEISEQMILDIVKHTCCEKKGKLIIPAFSLGRTQELVYTLDRLETAGKLPKIKVYVDSPLSINATHVMRMHPECFNKDIHEYMNTDPNPFGFNNLEYIRDASDSKRLNTLKEPCIIISSSGMMSAGRVKHHIRNNVSNPNNTLLIVGYCAPGTLGRKFMNREKKVRLFGEMMDVKFQIEQMDSYSAHADYEEMLEYYTRTQDLTKIKKTFLVHGEYDSQVAYRARMEDAGFTNVEIPSKGQEFEV